jgi:hypothetical protein
MRAVGSTLLAMALAVATGRGYGQDFHYVEPGVASCPAAPAPGSAAPKPVARGVPVPGRITVACGFDQGSYTLTLNSTDPGATFSPKTFLVNFGRLAGSGVFSVRFSTVGVQSVSVAITSNMGSPVVRGRFVSPAHEYEVVAR